MEEETNQASGYLVRDRAKLNLLVGRKGYQRFRRMNSTKQSRILVTVSRKFDAMMKAIIQGGEEALFSNGEILNKEWK